MRLLQNSGLNPSYRPRLADLVGQGRGFEQQKEVFLNDRYGAAHILLPILGRSPEAFFTNGDDESLQRAWGTAKTGWAKIRASIDMAGPDRGNMRCFETMGAGALLISDSGNYPEPMRDGETLVVYDQPQDALDRIEQQLDSGSWDKIGWAGNRTIREEYSKKRQYGRFLELA
jgi:hypothetical protein